VAVVIRKRMLVGGAEVELRTYQPAGRLEKKDRKQADELDTALAVRVPQLADEVLRLVGDQDSLVRRWYVLGQRLREIVEDEKLVSTADVNSGLVWQAIWYYLPDSLKPRSGEAEQYSERQHGRKDHLTLCYEIAAFEWNDVQWIQRWDDWSQLAYRPGLVRDPRVLETLATTMRGLKSYPRGEAFKEIVKRLGEAFPTRRMRDSSLLPSEKIAQTVNEAVRQVVGEDGA